MRLTKKAAFLWKTVWCYFPGSNLNPYQTTKCKHYLVYHRLGMLLMLWISSFFCFFHDNEILQIILITTKNYKFSSFIIVLKMIKLRSYKNFNLSVSKKKCIALLKNNLIKMSHFELDILILIFNQKSGF